MVNLPFPSVFPSLQGRNLCRPAAIPTNDGDIKCRVYLITITCNAKECYQDIKLKIWLVIYLSLSEELSCREAQSF